jgi:hypothetical protein
MFVQTRVTGFDLAERRLLTKADPMPYTHPVLGLVSWMNDFAIPGLAERALSLYSIDDAECVWAAVNAAVQAAARERGLERQRRLLTMVGWLGPHLRVRGARGDALTIVRGRGRQRRVFPAGQLEEAIRDQAA